MIANTETKGIIMLSSHQEVLHQAINLLSDISKDDYVEIRQPYFSSSIGEHFRHVLDHFTALQLGHDQGFVNYNIRNRHSQIELFPELAKIQFTALQNWLGKLVENDLNTSFVVESEISISDKHSVNVTSNLARELLFTTSHAIHHYAMIKVIRLLQNAEVPTDFGFAPATWTYLNQNLGSNY